MRAPKSDKKVIRQKLLENREKGAAIFESAGLPSGLFDRCLANMFGQMHLEVLTAARPVRKGYMLPRGGQKK